MHLEPIMGWGENTGEIMGYREVADPGDSLATQLTNFTPAAPQVGSDNWGPVDPITKPFYIDGAVGTGQYDPYTGALTSAYVDKNGNRTFYDASGKPTTSVSLKSDGLFQDLLPAVIDLAPALLFTAGMTALGAGAGGSAASVGAGEAAGSGSLYDITSGVTFPTQGLSAGGSLEGLSTTGLLPGLESMGGAQGLSIGTAGGLLGEAGLATSLSSILGGMNPLTGQALGSALENLDTSILESAGIPASSLDSLKEAIKNNPNLIGQVGKALLAGGGIGSLASGLSALKDTSNIPAYKPAESMPTYSPEYYQQVQQYYNTYLPAKPANVATPLQQWYDTGYSPDSVTAKLFSGG